VSCRSRPDTRIPHDAFDSGDAWVQVRPLSWVDGWPVTGRALVPVPGEQGPPGSWPPCPSLAL